MTKDEFAWLSGLQHVSIPASKDHIYLTFDNREHAIAARARLDRPLEICLLPYLIH